MEHDCDSSTWEEQAGGPEIQDQPQLHGEFKASLGYMKLSKNNRNSQKLAISNFFWTYEAQLSDFFVVVWFSLWR